jgi:hypothetical protein
LIADWPANHPDRTGILIFAVQFWAEDFLQKDVFFLAHQRETAVEQGASEKKIPKGIIIVIDVENQL